MTENTGLKMTAFVPLAAAEEVCYSELLGSAGPVIKGAGEFAVLSATIMR